MKNYEAELPLNYRLVKTIDAKNKTVGIVLNLIALAVLAVSVAVACIIIRFDFSELVSSREGYANIIRLAVFIAVMIAYVILHELVHGAAYKIMTKRKLTFGLTFSVAFCGVPDIYVYRKTALIAVLAPFVVFLPIFTALPFFLSNPLEKVLASFLWGMHVGGCSGDLWVTGVLLFKLRDKTTLMNDTGPKQTFYVIDVNAVAEEDPTEQAADGTDAE